MWRSTMVCSSCASIFVPVRDRGVEAPTATVGPVTQPPRSPRSERFAATMAAIDAVNATDPTTATIGDDRGPKELVHARAMSSWLDRLDPQADELQHLAARAHHLRRWERPRSDYPEGRAGYLRWRTDARRFHSDEIAAILGAQGYSELDVQRVVSIVRKDGIGAADRSSVDPAVQTHEDALCLVFLQAQLTGVAGQLGASATVAVLVKTMAKMSDKGIAVASTVALDEASRSLFAAALSERASGTDVVKP